MLNIPRFEMPDEIPAFAGAEKPKEKSYENAGAGTVSKIKQGRKIRPSCNFAPAFRSYVCGSCVSVILILCFFSEPQLEAVPQFPDDVQ